MEFTAKQPHVILFYKMTPESRSLPCLMGRHRTDFLPILQHPAAPWRQLAVIAATAPIEKTNLIFIMAPFSSVRSSVEGKKSVGATNATEPPRLVRKLLRN